MFRQSRKRENLVWRGEVIKQIRIPRRGATASSAFSRASYPESTAARIQREEGGIGGGGKGRGKKLKKELGEGGVKQGE